MVTETPLDVTIPLKPAYSDTVTDTNLGMIGVVISGAQMFNDYEDPTRTFIAVDDNFTVDGVAFVDSCNGHPLALNVGGGNYHYHGIPYCITDGIDVAGEHSHILGFLLDGFPLYGPQGTDGSKLVTGNLDECNAHFGPTPEFPNGIYHYHLKEDKSPYTPDCYHGEVTVAGNSGGGPPVAALPVAVRPGPPVDEPVTQRAVGASGSVSPGCCRSLSLCGSGSLCGSSRSTAVTALRLCSQTRKPSSCSTSRCFGKVAHDVVYVVEQRARPAYRIFSFDPSTGADKTVFTVPTDAIIYGIALSPDRSTLAVAYSADFHTEGSGLSTLDVASGKLTEVVPAQPNVYLTDLEWSVDGRSVLATHVDRTGTDEQLGISRISLADKSATMIVDDAIAPVVDGDGLHYLTVDSAHARRAIGHLDGAGTSTAIAVGDGGFDLDHLIAGGDQASLHVAVLNANKGGAVSLGTPADAHGNHKVPSTWWDVAVTPSTATPTALAPIIVYDAASSGDSLVYATQEGLAIAVDGSRTDLIASRAIRFVAA